MVFFSPQRPIDFILNELKSFVPDEFLKDALSSNGALHEYLQMLKELKVQMNHVQEFLDAHIELLEKYGQKDDTKSIKDDASVSSKGLYHASAAPSVRSTSITNTKQTEHYVFAQKDQASSHMSPGYSFGHFEMEGHGRSQIPYTPQVQATAMYKMVVSGNTLNSHLDVMEKIKRNVRSVLNLQETEHDDHCQVIIVFCPVVTRAGTDVITALQGISETKPVILVMMHHSRKAQAPPIVNPRDHNVVLLVDLFFHETEPGLLKCPQNEEAIVAIQNKLQLLYSVKTLDKN